MFTKKDLSRLIIPLIIEQLLAVTIGMADTIMVASCGEAAVSGVSLVDTINFLLINIFSALATGGAIVVSQYLGRDDRKNANTAAQQLIVVTTLLAVVIMAIALIGKKPILHLIFGNIETSVMENCYIYFFWSAISYPFLALYNAGAALFRAMGNSKVSMLVSILMNAVNITGNAILIFGFGMGVAGAAIATLISRMLGAVIVTILLKRQGNSKIHLESFSHFSFHPTMIKNILKIGVPNGLENGMFQVGKILVQGLIASFGTVAIAANAVANSVAGLSQIPGIAIGLAMITVVGQCVGARNFDDAKRYMKKLTLLSYLAMTGLNLFLILIISPAVGFFQLSGETSSVAIQLLIYHSICCIIIWPAAFVLPNGLRAANDVKFTMSVSILSMWIFRIGFSYLLGQMLGMGVLGVWIAMTIDWVVRSICFIIRLARGKWKNHRPI